MSIRISQLTVEPDEKAWALGSEGTDVTSDETYRLDLLSVVRQIMRERSDCSIIPVVVAVVRFPDVNQWGHNGEVEVVYSRRGYRAIYGVHFGETVTNIQCYMD